MIFAGGHSLASSWWDRRTVLSCRGCKRTFANVAAAISEPCDVERTPAHYPQAES